MSLPTTKVPSAPSRPLHPPTAHGWPVMGALPTFARDPIAYLHQAQARYGDIYTLDLGFLRWVILSHPRHIEQVLVTQAHNYRKAGALWEILRVLFGNGLAVSEGDFWLRQRRMMQPHFHRQRLDGLTTAMVATIADNLSGWESAAQSQQPFDVMPAFSTLTMRVVARTLFGQGLAHHELTLVEQALDYLVRYTTLGVTTYALPTWLPLPGARRYRRTIRELDTVIYRLINHERQATTPSDSLLTLLLQMVDAESNEQMTNQQLRDEVTNFFVAGYETTSLALTWVIQLLTQHPAAMQQVQAEIDTVLQGRTPTFADLSALTYTRWVLQEALRLRPPVWWLQRVAQADDEIDGYAIPAGTTVVTYIYGVHHHPQIWHNPEQFDPERFAPARMAQQTKQAWIPFGAGQRQCIGRDFALMEEQLVLTLLLQRYALSALPGQDLRPSFTTTLRPNRGMWVNLSKRDVCFSSHSGKVTS